MEDEIRWMHICRMRQMYLHVNATNIFLRSTGVSINDRIAPISYDVDRVGRYGSWSRGERREVNCLMIAVQAADCREVEMVSIGVKIGNGIEVARARPRICNRVIDISIATAPTCHRIATTTAGEGVVLCATYERIGVCTADEVKGVMRSRVSIDSQATL